MARPKKGPITAGDNDRRKCRIGRRLVDLRPMGVVCRLNVNPDPRLGVYSALTYRVHGLPPADSPRLLALNGLIRPEVTVLLVNALLLATRWMMSSGAMTCRIRRYIRQPVRKSGS